MVDIVLPLPTSMVDGGRHGRPSSSSNEGRRVGSREGADGQKNRIHSINETDRQFFEILMNLCLSPPWTTNLCRRPDE